MIRYAIDPDLSAVLERVARQTHDRGNELERISARQIYTRLRAGVRPFSKTGRLLRSIEEKETSSGWSVRSRAPHFVVQDLGGEVRARSGAMAIPIGNAPRFTRSARALAPLQGKNGLVLVRLRQRRAEPVYALRRVVRLRGKHFTRPALDASLRAVERTGGALLESD